MGDLIKYVIVDKDTLCHVEVIANHSKPELMKNVALAMRK